MVSTNHQWDLILSIAYFKISYPTIIGEKKLTNRSARKRRFQNLQAIWLQMYKLCKSNDHKNVASINIYSR